MKKKIGILGGSFDPVHKTHAALAMSACVQTRLDELMIVPAHQAPLRDNPTLTPDSDRLAMLGIAFSDFPYPWKICDFEMRRGGTGYSVDTAKFLSGQNPEAELYWIIGADHLAKLSKWRDIETLSKIVTFVCAARKGYDFALSAAPACVKIKPLEFEPVADSSTFVRAALDSSAAHLMLDSRVRDYIFKHKLYGISQS